MRGTCQKEGCNKIYNWSVSWTSPLCSEHIDEKMEEYWGKKEMERQLANIRVERVIVVLALIAGLIWAVNGR